jgi:hypothetical protein
MIVAQQLLLITTLYLLCQTIYACICKITYCYIYKIIIIIYIYIIILCISVMTYLAFRICVAIEELIDSA